MISSLIFIDYMVCNFSNENQELPSIMLCLPVSCFCQLFLFFFFFFFQFTCYKGAVLTEERMSRSMQLHYIPVTSFSSNDLCLDRNSLE